MSTNFGIKWAWGIAGVVLVNLGGGVPAQFLPPQEISKATRADQDRFGTRLALSGNLLVGSAPASSDIASRGGVLAPLDRPTSASFWQIRPAFGYTGQTANKYLSTGLALDGQTLAASTFPQNPEGTETTGGEILIYEHNGSSWQQRQLIPSPEPDSATRFGYNIEIDDNLMAVDHLGSFVEPGIRLYQREGTTWTFDRVIPSPFHDKPGHRGLFLKDSILAFTRRDTTTATNPRVETLRFDGTNWNPLGILSSPTGETTTSFGYSIASSGKTLFVSAPLADGAAVDSGQIFAFRLFRNTWRHFATILPNDPKLRGNFGQMVAAYQGRLVGAAPGFPGIVSIFNQTRTGGFAFRFNAVLASIQPNSGHGTGLDMENETLVIGYPGADVQTGSFPPTFAQIDSGFGASFPVPFLNHLSVIPMDTTNTMAAGTPGPDPLFGFALDNLGATETNYTVAAGAPWLEPYPGLTNAPIAAGGEAEILFRPTATTQALTPALYSTTISVTRLSDGDTIVHPVSLLVTGGTPEATVLSPSGQAVASGSTQPDVALGTQYPVVPVGSSLVLNWSLRNSGTGPLIIPSPTVTISGDGAFSVVSQPSPLIINPGDSRTFQIRFAPPDNTERQATITVASNAVTHPVYTFVVSGRGATGELSLSGAGNPIANGDTSPSLTDLTDFGQVSTQYTHKIQRTYILTNTGQRFITMGAITATPPVAGFSGRVSKPLLEVGESANLLVEYTPTQGPGAVPAIISVGEEGAVSPLFSFAVQATNTAPTALTSQPSTALSNSSAWLNLGATDGALDTLNLGDRYYDSANQALVSELFPNTLTRAVGWYESTDHDLPYSAIGENSIIRATFDLAQSGAGADRTNPASARKMPNFRLRVMERFVLNAMLEVGPNDAGVDPGVTDAALELAPSRDLSRPSRYKVDLDPIDVPYLTNSVRFTEGMQRGFEAVAEVTPLTPNSTEIEGRILLMSSSLSTYPDPGRTAPALKVFGANAADFTQSGININLFQLAHDPLALGQVVGLTTETQVDVVRSANGISVTTQRVLPDTIAVAAFDFLEGTASDVGRPESQLRIDPERLYKVSALITANNASDASPQIRLRARSVKFQWNAKLELGGARAVGSPEGLTLAAQLLPGVGSQNPDLDSATGGRWYHLYFSSPMDPAIRSDVAGTIEQKFPILSSQPGYGDPTAQSFRNLRIGWDVIDSFSYGQGYENEFARDLTLRRVEIRSLPQPGGTNN